MGKFAKQAKPEKTAEEKPIPKPCARCEWDFERDNKKLHYFHKDKPSERRTEPRSRVHIKDRGGIVITRCDLCYEQELWHAGKHPNQGSELYEKGLFSKFIHLTDDGRREKHARKDFGDALIDRGSHGK